VQVGAKLLSRVAAWIGSALVIACAIAISVPGPAIAAPCSNESVRTGASALLPNCRAYELVTPSSNDHLRLGVWNNVASANNLFPTENLNSAGDSVVYLADGGALPFMDEGRGNFEEYEAIRTPDGWLTTRGLSPSGEEALPLEVDSVSEAHQYGFFQVFAFGGGEENGTLGREGTVNYLGKPDGSFEPIGVGSLGTEGRAEGRWISPDGSHIVFSTRGPQCNGSSDCAGNQLEPNAPSTGTPAVYDRGPDGPTKVISLLPGDVTPAAGEGADYQGSSRDGTVIAFKLGGALYARIDGEETVAVTGGATFGGISSHGETIFSVQSGDIGDIFAYDVASATADQVTTSGDAQMVTISADGSHAFFLSPSQLDGTKGAAGQPNLYSWSKAGGISFIATVSTTDLEGLPALNAWTSRAVRPDGSGPSFGPGTSTARTTPDGSVLAFESAAQLTSYDNAGHTEIYRWDEGSEGPECVSCNPLQEPASSDARLQSVGVESFGTDFSGTTFMTVINNLTADGSRVFFETEEALVGRDSDGINDVYEWSAEREGVPSAAMLISSGKTPESVNRVEAFGNVFEFSFEANNLLGVSPNGGDVLIGTRDKLVANGSPEGVPVIYDAREGGGFGVTTPTPCEGDACQSEAPAPHLNLPTSNGFQGRGNVKERHCRRRARAKKHRPCRHRHKKHGRRRHQQSAQSQSAQSATVGAGGSTGLSSSVTKPSSGRDDRPVTRAGEFEGYRVESVSGEETTSEAGMHPDLTTEFSVDSTGELSAIEDLAFRVPPGLSGNPTNFPRCSIAQIWQPQGGCPIDSQVGVEELAIHGTGSGFGNPHPLFNVDPGPDMVARLAFYPVVKPVFIDLVVDPTDHYRVLARAEGVDSSVSLEGAKTILWGVPADPSHDELRRTQFEATFCPGNDACLAGGKRSSSLTPAPFVNNPAACEEQPLDLALTTYQLPGQVFTGHGELPPTTDCDKVPFDPSLQVAPTSHRAGAPTGLRAVLQIPQTNAVNLPASSPVKDAAVTLPEGMTISTGAADGLEACSASQVGFEEDVESDCPEAAKLGSATFVSPALPRAMHGAVYQRDPEPGHLFRIWLVSDEFGVHLKLPGEIHADSQTGQLTTVFHETPQLPVETIELELKGGARAPLKNPEDCGTYATKYELTPWSGSPPVVGESQMTIDEGCGSAGGFSPKLSAGVTNPVAGSYSPLVVQLTREDGEENIGSFNLTLPPGQLAKLAGVPLCPEAAAPTGACPAGSQIGSVAVASGAGPQPLWIPQPGKAPATVYLAGSYKGAPYSVITKVPAQAGPFDLGVVAVRSALYVNPDTAQATVRTDDLPQILEGVPVLYRTLHVSINRDQFALAPTNCKEMSVDATVASTHGAVAHPSDRFQVGECAALKFVPSLKLRLKGGTKRAQYPALTATLKTHKGEANIRKASVALPHSEFLAQEHINTICTRVQFSEDKCPKGSVYGKVRATTPLLGQPLEGLVYLRSSSNPLPDLVVALRGQIDINLVGRIDSVNGGIRTTFSGVPDAPVTKFVLRMKGGAKGLIVNSTDICQTKHRATVKMDGQNGKVHDSHPVLKGSCK
jgi:hypothetical protein